MRIVNRTTPFDEMDRLFDQLRGSMLAGSPRANFRGSNVRIDANDDDGYIVTADVPGFERDEIDLRFDDGVLTIDAVHETETDGTVRSRTVHEWVHVPGTVAVEAAEASYHNEVLEVRLPTTADDDSGHRIVVD